MCWRVMSLSRINKVWLPEIIGGGYGKFWKSKQRYVVDKGGRASKKSSNASLKIVTRMMQYPLANTVVFRRTYDSLRDSCFAQLKWAIHRLGVDDYWEARVSPLELIYKPTGQKIMFRGLDNPLKITSITVDVGVICFAWLEEAYELDDETVFDKIDGSLRGEMPDGYYIQWLITFNPWDSGHWLKRRFFDTPDEDVLAITTNYMCNEWLTDQDRKWFERIRRTDENRYKVEGLGEWGIAEGQFFKQWESAVHVIEPFAIPKGWMRFRAMDWGSAHPYEVLWWAVDYDDNLYAYRELYGWGGKPNVGTGETAKEVGKKIAALESKDENLSYAVLDNACWAATGVTGPTIAEEINMELYNAGLQTFAKCSKGRVEGANALKQRLIGNELTDGSFKPAIYFFSNCIHAIRTIPMLAHDKHNPETYDTGGEDHAADTVCYACMSRPWVPLEQSKRKSSHDGYNIDNKRASAWSA